jgi:hypothetical protein
MKSICALGRVQIRKTPKGYKKWHPCGRRDLLEE